MTKTLFATIPSVDKLLARSEAKDLIDRYGRDLVKDALRGLCAELRWALARAGEAALPDDVLAWFDRTAVAKLGAITAPTLKPVFNLTGTVLHTNLGRAPLPAEAVQAMCTAAGACNVEMDLESGRRSDRDEHVESLVQRITGAAAATVVNNNAAAVLLVLNSLAAGREVPVSRGELIEIGGSFRMPDIMSRAGCRLVEVGTTNRTHARDFVQAIGSETALLMKVHTSNYEVRGFTASVEEAELASLAHEHRLPCIDDLGSGSLIDLSRFGLPKETTPQFALEAGMDIVTFSGDKLLGGPQCGIIAGSAELVKRIKSNPMKRAMRLDKVTMAALAAVLQLYARPEQVMHRIPGLRLISRPADEIEAVAKRVAPKIAERLETTAMIDVATCESQIGSGALPLAALPSSAIRLRPGDGPNAGKIEALAAAFRALSTPVVGRIHGGALWFDMRCLEDEAGFIEQLGQLDKQ